MLFWLIRKGAFCSEIRVGWSREYFTGWRLRLQRPRPSTALSIFGWLMNERVTRRRLFNPQKCTEYTNKNNKCTRGKFAGIFGVISVPYGSQIWKRWRYFINFIWKKKNDNMTMKFCDKRQRSYWVVSAKSGSSVCFDSRLASGSGRAPPRGRVRRSRWDSAPSPWLRRHPIVRPHLPPPTPSSQDEYPAARKNPNTVPFKTIKSSIQLII